MAEPVVSGRGVEVRYVAAGREARAVDGVDIDVAAGEVVALAGESGCGKSSLARALLGLEKPAAGSVSWRGDRLRYSARALRAFHGDVGFVPQDPAGALNPRHTVYEAVAEGLRIQRRCGDESAMVSQALEWVGLTPPQRFAAAYPRQLSGGQKQRVLIAGALVLEPSLVVADEPVASLDASVSGEILALLLRLREDFGTACLIVSHDLSVAWSISDRTLVMYGGRIVESGDTGTVLTAPRHPYTRALVSVLPESRLEPVVLDGEPPDATAIAAGCRFHPRCPVLADGTAAAVGVDAACRTLDLPVAAAGGVSVACHVDDARALAVAWCCWVTVVRRLGGMIVVHTRVRCRGHHRDAFVALLRRWEDETRTETGCLRYEYLVDRDDDCVFHGVEEWRDRDSLLAHLAAPHMNDPHSRVDQFSAEAESVRVFDAVEVSL